MPFRNYSLTKNGQLTIGQILSPNYAAGVSGWEVRKDGSAEFNDLTIRGTFNGNDFLITAAGLYFYAGTPAAGNPPVLYYSQAPADPYGNAVTQNELVSAGASGSAALAAGAVQVTTTGSSRTGQVVLSAESWRPGAMVLSGAASYWTDATLIIPAAAAVDPQNSQLAETWHNMTLANGWTTTQYAQYKLMPDGTVMIRADGLTPGTLTNGTTIWTAPAGYVPADNINIPVMVVSTVTPASTPKLYLRSSGALEVYNFSGVTSAGFCASYPFD